MPRTDVSCPSRVPLLVGTLCMTLVVVLPQAVFSHGKEGRLADPYLNTLRVPYHSMPPNPLAAALLHETKACVNGGVMGKDNFCICPDPLKFAGVFCEQCQRDEVCSALTGEPSECNHNFAIRGTNKQFECSLQSPFFLNLLGGGRNVSALATINCSIEDNTPFLRNSSNGRCSISLNRIEPNREYIDTFFSCETSACTMQVTRNMTNAKTGADSTRNRVFKVLPVIGQVVILFPCVLLALLGCFATTFGPKQMKRVVIVLGGMQVSVTLLFILLMLLVMYPVESEVLVSYDCKTTKCACGENPPKEYQPFCSESLVGESILPSIQNGVAFICNSITHVCKLTLSDIALVFDLQCNASECVNTRTFPDFPGGGLEPHVSQVKRNLVLLLVISCVVLAASIAAHVFRMSSRSRRKAAEFRLIFGLSGQSLQPGSPHHTHYQDDYNNGNKTNNTSGEDGTENCVRNTRCGWLVRKKELQEVGENRYDEDAVPDGDCLIGLVSNSRQRRSSAVGSKRTLLEGVLHHKDEEVELIRNLSSSPFEIRLKDLGYTLPSSRFAASNEARTRDILQQINFTVRSGEVLAIIGSSGAGKTTLLDILSARSKSGQTTGDMSFNGTPLLNAPSKVIHQYRNIIGYVSQEDTLLPALTVRQTIEYAARLKLPQAFSNTTIGHIVHHMIQALKLQRCEHTRIGDGGSVRGVSGGEKRRVSIAVELLANPRILFLDEPTSGLDVVSAKRVIEAVVGLVKESPMQMHAPLYFAFKPIIIFSIHQPSQEIFDLFDKLLLLSCGMSLYCGPARNAAEILEARVNRAVGSAQTVPSSSDYPNHAEYIMKLDETLDDAARMRIQAEDTAQSSESAYSHEKRDFLEQSLQYTEKGENREDGVAGLGETTTMLVPGDDILQIAALFRAYYANLYQQFALLTSRAGSCLISSVHLLVAHAAVTASVGVLIVFLYREQNLDLPGALNRAGSITFLLLVVSFLSLSSLELLVSERKLFIVERENGFYRTLPYLLSKVVMDIIPLRVVPALLLASLIYFPMGLRTDDGIYFFWFVVIVVLFSVCITLFVLCIGILCKSFGSAALVSSVFILWNFVFGGFLVQSETVPAFLLPFQLFSPFFIAFEALLVNELDGQACTFAPTDETGKQSSTSIPIMCLQYLSNMGLKPQRFTLDVVQLAGLVGLLFGLSWLFLSKFVAVAR